MAFLLAIG